LMLEPVADGRAGHGGIIAQTRTEARCGSSAAGRTSIASSCE
jgi:hypothetical protein